MLIEGNLENTENSNREFTCDFTLKVTTFDIWVYVLFPTFFPRIFNLENITLAFSLFNKAHDKEIWLAGVYVVNFEKENRP